MMSSPGHASGRTALRSAEAAHAKRRHALHIAVTAGLLAIGGAPAALAQTSAVCGQFSWSVGREQKAFGASGLPTVKSGTDYPGVAQAVTLALEPQSTVTYPKPPGRPPKSNPAYGAVLTLPAIATAGTYQVTVSDEAWVDLVQNGTKIRFSAYSRKAGCPEVRKSLRFKLAPGPLTIEISDSSKPDIKLDLLPSE